MDLGPKRYTHLRSAKGVDPSGFFSLQDTDASSREPSTPGSTPKSGKMPKAHMLQDKGPGSRVRGTKNTRRFGLVFFVLMFFRDSKQVICSSSSCSFFFCSFFFRGFNWHESCQLTLMKFLGGSTHDLRVHCLLRTKLPSLKTNSKST